MSLQPVELSFLAAVGKNTMSPCCNAMCLEGDRSTERPQCATCVMLNGGEVTRHAMLQNEQQNTCVVLVSFGEPCVIIRLGKKYCHESCCRKAKYEDTGDQACGEGTFLEGLVNISWDRPTLSHKPELSSAPARFRRDCGTGCAALQICMQPLAVMP